jgi:hypothetical protein
MDEAAFRAARPVVTGDGCLFEHALLAQCAGCSYAVPHALGAADASDVHGLLAAADHCYGSFADTPWPAETAAVATWQGRRRYGPPR